MRRQGANWVGRACTSDGERGRGGVWNAPSLGGSLRPTGRLLELPGCPTLAGRAAEAPAQALAAMEACIAGALRLQAHECGVEVRKDQRGVAADQAPLDA